MSNKDKSGDIDIINVDQAVRNAIKKYWDKGMLLDGLFWNHCIGLLEKKYNFKLEGGTQ
jgi:hypothetical protein